MNDRRTAIAFWISMALFTLAFWLLLWIAVME